jgi:hypothetical protein
LTNSDLDFSKLDEEFESLKNVKQKFTNEDPFSVIDSNGNATIPKTSNDTNNNFDAFKDDFEDEFSKLNLSAIKYETKKENYFDANFAEFDAFNNNPTILNNTSGTISKPVKTNKFDNFTNNLNGDKSNVKDTSTEKVFKFSEDYSKNFDDDLEVVLQRSLVDK